MDVVDKIIELTDLFDDNVVTTADKIPQPEPKKEVQDIEAINAFMKRNPMAGGGMLVQPTVDGSRPGYKKAFKKKDNLPKNIRLTPQGKYRFTTEIGSLVKEGNRMGSMTFPKGTDLQDVIKFRDDYLKKAGGGIARMLGE